MARQVVTTAFRPGRGLRAATLLLGLAALAAAKPVQAQGSAVDPQTVNGILLPYIRREFYEAVEDAKATRGLIAYIEEHFGPDPSGYPPAVKGYYAALEGLKGKHETNLLRKYRYVTAAIAMMDPLVEAHPGLLEVRFLRFSFYQQIPAVFGVHHHVPADLRAIIGMLDAGLGEELPRAVRADMIEYILGTDEPSAGQRRMLLGLAGR
ncbi:MAG: hypothetical protein JW820_03285 [Spirochaetales bacterium]|nr:hypothetical protein [Spirochaetales bacterium]